jgi:signal transduction histidine kinase
VAASSDAAELAARIEAQRAFVDRVRSAERRLLAREVHDRLGQLLTAANIDLRLLERRTEDGAAVPRDELLRELGSARAGIGQAIASVQDIALLLRPTTLDGGGLAAALRRQADEFQQRFRIGCTVRLPGAGHPEPAPAVAGELLRICQEALANVLRHAHASRVQVQLAVRARQLLLRVSDDGVGIPRGAADAPASIGIAGMRERAAGIGARLQVRGRPGCGTIVSVRRPLARR